MRAFRHLFFLFSLLLCRVLFAQDQRLVDSLQQALAKTGKDTNRVRVLNELSRIWYQVEQTQSERAAREALDLGLKLTDIRGLSVSYNHLGNILADQGDRKGAIEHYRKALTYRERLRDSQAVAISYNNIGLIYSESGDKYTAIDYYVKGLSIADKIQYARAQGLLSGNIGIVYYDLKNYDYSEKYALRSMEIHTKAGNTWALAPCHNNLGVVYEARGQYALAQEQYEKAITIAREENNQYRVATYVDNLGVLMQRLGDAEAALKFHLEALSIRRELKDPAIFNSLINAAGDYLLLRNPAAAKPMLDEAYEIARAANNKWQLKECYQSMAEHRAMTGRYDEAYELYRNYNRLKDSLISGESNRQLAEVTARYNTEKQERENEALRKDNALKDAEARRSDAEAQRSATVRNFLYGIIALFLLLALALFYAYRNKQRSNVTLSQQNMQIEFQKKEITDSITYARRIQQSILPPPQEMQKFFPHSFVLYLPKDIVSGDFYWLAQSGSTILVAAADCTGHGVPGAFMSMLGIDKLNEIVKQNARPGEMLQQLNRSVKNTLRQDVGAGSSEGAMQDGMDIVLCAITRETLRYAGANRPLWLFRNGELHELKPTKAPIGGFTAEEQVWEEQTIALQPGDRLYLFTDGFADQFGGPEGKKFMTRRMRRLLVSLQDQPLPAQKAALHEALAQWQGANQQVDDVLVIGMEI